MNAFTLPEASPRESGGSRRAGRSCGPLAAGRRALLLTGIVVALAFSSVSYVALVPAAADSMPTRLTDQEFWKLVTDFSEPNGFFRSDNLLSNESYFQHVLNDLVNTVKSGEVYMGVGPEQNFTYIAATKPAMVFIVDIRRGNLDLQLLYKALFEMASDRPDFVSKLFSRKRPEGLSGSASVAEIFAAFKGTEINEEVFTQNMKAVTEHLTTKTHKLALLPDDLQGIEYVYRAFYKYGPQIQYSSTGSFGGSFQPSYADLMVATDGNQMRSYLASDESFQVMKDLESKNLLVPVVGNFAGAKAIRGIGQYVRQKGGFVSTFYLSNVEQYLKMDGIWGTFCANVATLPLDKSSRFIRSVRNTTNIQITGLASELGDIMSDVKDCSNAP
jgi:hypothetical protein